MIEVKIITDNARLYNEKAVHPLQAWEWGEARKKMGIEVLRIGEFENGNLGNVYQLTFHKLPFTNFKIGYLPRSESPSREVLSFLYDYGKQKNIIFIKIEPYVPAKNYKLRTMDYELVESSHPLFPRWTQILDVSLSEDQLLKKMKEKTRYNVRLSQKKGVVVKEMNNEEGFQIFAKLYFETCKRQKYYGHNYKYHEIVWKTLKNNITHILVAYYNTAPLAAFELFHFHDSVYYLYGGTSLEYRNFMASNLIMWEALRLAKRLRAKKFDMWGSLPPNYDLHHPWSGFTRYKEGYGGTFVEFVGSYDLVILPTHYKVYNVLDLVRRKFLELRKSFS